VNEAISVVRAKSEELARVIALSKPHQSTLGQLPYEAFQTFAAEKRVLAAWSGDDLAGYAIYRVRKRTGVAVLVHLCVDPIHRGARHADRLVDEICNRHPFAPGLAAWCREDYPAHRRWPQLGFDRNATRLGRGREGRRLVHWWRPINELTLFTYTADAEGVPAAAIDTNVFRDIVEARMDFMESVALDEPWLIDSVKLVVTGQLIGEINEASDFVPLLKGATERYHRVSPPAAEWQPLFRELSTVLQHTSIEVNDRRQLAQACAGDARFFVTRDGAVLASRDVIEPITGLQVVTPLELLLLVHSDQFELNYRPAALRDSDLEIRHPSSVPTKDELGPFTNHDEGEKTSELVREVGAVATGVVSGSRLWEVGPPGKPPIAIAATSVADRVLRVHSLRVRRDKHRATFARQMLHVFREEAIERGLGRVRFEGAASGYLNEALAAEGYVVGADGWSARCQLGFVGPNDTVPEVQPATRSSDLEPDQVSQLERVLWPTKIVGGNVPTYIVPIQPTWARALFDDRPKQAELLPRPAGLGLAREHVYYKSLNRRIQGPARLLWWVSGGGFNGGMRAASWLEAAVSGRPRTLFRRFGAQGIYEQRAVERLAHRPGAEISVLVFSRTEVFNIPIPIDVARAICPLLRLNGYLQTTRRVDEHVFADFYRIGMSPQ
jgi:hypothetical protein